MTAAAVRQLAEKYGMDVERLERLVRSVNVPYVREPPLGDGAGVGTARYVRDAESGENVVVKEVSCCFLGEGVSMGVNVFYFFRTGGVEGANACCVMTVNDIQAS